MLRASAILLTVGVGLGAPSPSLACSIVSNASIEEPVEIAKSPGQDDFAAADAVVIAEPVFIGIIQSTPAPKETIKKLGLPDWGQSVSLKVDKWVKGAPAQGTLEVIDVPPPVYVCQPGGRFGLPCLFAGCQKPKWKVYLVRRAGVLVVFRANQIDPAHEP